MTPELDLGSPAALLRDAHIGITNLYNFAVLAVTVSAVLLNSIPRKPVR